MVEQYFCKSIKAHSILGAFSNDLFPQPERWEFVKSCELAGAGSRLSFNDSAQVGPSLTDDWLSEVLQMSCTNMLLKDRITRH